VSDEDLKATMQKTVDYVSTLPAERKVEEAAHREVGLRTRTKHGTICTTMQQTARAAE
jgi:hypothetical protein